MRPSTIESLGLGTVLDIFKRGAMPASAAELVDRVFGPANKRGALVITGANGIVGAGKTMQLGRLLEPYGVPVVALDFPGVPAGLVKQYPGLVRGLGKDRAAAIMANVVQLSYDGAHLPRHLSPFNPRFVLEAIPEILEIKRAHYQVFRAEYPEVEIRSVTSGFPSRELGVGIAHPAFPHEINKVWEIVEPKPSPITALYWSLGMIPVMVSDHWSFVLDVLFTGVTLAALRYNAASNMPYWKVDKYVRRLVGPNPLRAHDAIGAKGANFLTWSCLEHLSKRYGPLFQPTASLVEKKDSGQDWYPPNHFRPMVNWPLEGQEVDEFNTWILGPLFQMTSLMLHEERAPLPQMNAIGELCAQFRDGIITVIRRHGSDAVIRTVEAYHRLYPAAAKSPWYPEAFAKMDAPEWQQLYVNAEHDGTVGVITISRESYSHDVDAELNRAIDWLKARKIDRVIVTGDFHLSSQLVGADITDFFPAIEDHAKGIELSRNWSKTARRLNDEFAVSVGFINGKRCLGGMLELMVHCHYVIAVESADLGMPEVTLPVVPGMEGCHWMFRKATPEYWPRILDLLLDGRPAKAKDAVGWIVDYAGPVADAVQACWGAATGNTRLPKRAVADKGLTGVPRDVPGLRPADGGVEAGRKAILDTIQKACEATLAEAITIQARHSGEFMATPHCRNGVVGSAFAKTMAV
jgi:enoyl-CoA hydratase/carnithine racemase